MCQTSNDTNTPTHTDFGMYCPQASNPIHSSILGYFKDSFVIPSPPPMPPLFTPPPLTNPAITSLPSIPYPSLTPAYAPWAPPPSPNAANAPSSTPPYGSYARTYTRTAPPPPPPRPPPSCNGRSLVGKMTVSATTSAVSVIVGTVGLLVCTMQGVAAMVVSAIPFAITGLVVLIKPIASSVMLVAVQRHLVWSVSVRGHCCLRSCVAPAYVH